MDDVLVPRMSRAQFWGSFAVLVALFLVVEGPIWRHPWDIGAVNQAILLSYAPIPLLVVGCLLWSRRLGWVAFFLDTLSLTLLKYSVTFAFALFLWGFSSEPANPVAALGAHSARPSVDEAPPPASVIPEAQRGSMHGKVTDAAGSALAGASVFIDKGLEDFVFTPRAEALSLSNDGTGILPRFAVAQVGQSIEVHAADGQLHTVSALRDDNGAPAFLVPLLKSGVGSLAVVREPHAALHLVCTVHAETAATLVVVAHPFFTITDAAGRFALDHVPAARLTLKVSAPARAPHTEEVDLAPESSRELSIVLP